MAKLDVWKLINLPLDIQFDHFDYDGLNWWWNEELGLLIDHYNIIRKTSKDSFLFHYKDHKEIYHKVSHKVAEGFFTYQLDTFGNWLNKVNAET